MNNKFQFSNVRRMRLLRHSASSWSRNDNGFTLVEVLVVSGIFIIISTVIVAILIVITRGSKKSDSIVIVRQSGEQAMAQMVRIMRFAKSFTNSLDEPFPCNGTVQNNIKIIAAVDLSQYVFTCPSSPPTIPNFIGLNGTKLTNSNTVAVQACSFTCIQQAGGSPTIGISFTLSKINLSGALESDVVIPFNSSVTLRNISSD
ncbi:prepilin-type N-terminal cleavage/methylation domain-containing protein [Patescibacteria group bacterium]|nr:prepilin-type N-terminal cleavage/methylation domain-containing protein [Patescibacteria group bacterium]MBU4098135.1 prepilin-type N-terminal cleavage/methylation domain-containing protein [Patescibacteria group bacterium]